MGSLIDSWFLVERDESNGQHVEHTWNHVFVDATTSTGTESYSLAAFLTGDAPPEAKAALEAWLAIQLEREAAAVALPPRVRKLIEALKMILPPKDK